MTAALHPADPPLATDRVRRGGRAGKRAGGAQAFEQPPFRQLKNPFAPTCLLITSLDVSYAVCRSRWSPYH